MIKCPRDDVFASLADPHNDLRFRSGVLDLRHVSGSGIGARYAQGVKGPGGRPISADIEITELTPGEAISFQTLTGPIRPRGRYLLDAAEGGTRVRFELEADVKGLKRLIIPMVQKAMNNESASSTQARHRNSMTRSAIASNRPGPPTASRSRCRRSLTPIPLR